MKKPCLLVLIQSTKFKIPLLVAFEPNPLEKKVTSLVVVLNQTHLEQRKNLLPLQICHAPLPRAQPS